MELAKRPVSVAFVDLDHFKRINDEHGHDVGDEVLEEVAELIRAELRESDIVARFGGEEFVILLPDVGLRGARGVANRIRNSLIDSRLPVAATLSAGVATRQPGEALDDLVARADAALLKAKQEGRNRVRVAG